MTMESVTDFRILIRRDIYIEKLIFVQVYTFLKSDLDF